MQRARNVARVSVLLGLLILSLALAPVAATAQTSQVAPPPVLAMSAKTSSTSPHPDVQIYYSHGTSTASTSVTAGVLLRLAPSGLTAIPLTVSAFGDFNYTDPQPEAWMCYAAVLQYGPTGTWSGLSDTKCYVAMTGPINAKFLGLTVITPQSGTAPQAHVNLNADFSVLSLPKSLVILPPTGTPQVQTLGPNQSVPGHFYVDVPLSPGLTCFVEAGLFGNGIVPVSDMLCTRSASQ